MAFDTLVADLKRNVCAPEVAVLLVQHYIKRTGEPGDRIIGQLLRAGHLSPVAAAMILEERAVPPSPPPSPSGALPGEFPPTTAEQRKSLRTPLAFVGAPFLSAPSAEHIKMYMDTLLLLSTLLFGFSASFFVSFSASDLVDADDRWGAWCTNATIRALPRFDDWCGGLSLDASAAELSRWDARPSQEFGKRAIYTYSALGTSLLVGIATYIPMTFAQLEKRTEAALRHWWHLFQWPMHASMVLFIAGGACFGWTVSSLLRIVFPSDVDVMLIGKSGTWILVGVFQYATMLVGLAALIINLLLAVWWAAQLRRTDVDPDAGVRPAGITVSTPTL